MTKSQLAIQSLTACLINKRELSTPVDLDYKRVVESNRGAVPAFRLVRFPGLLPRPDVQVPPHPALHKAAELVSPNRYPFFPRRRSIFVPPIAIPSDVGLGGTAPGRSPVRGGPGSNCRRRRCPTA